MQALVVTRFGGPDVLEIHDMPTPLPAPNTELVQVQAGGLNFADVLTAQGGYPGTPPPPLIAGREFCGIQQSTRQRMMGYTQWAAFAEMTSA